jgi:hypothetical protein
MEILSILNNVKGYDEISINRLNAIAADDVNKFVVNEMAYIFQWSYHRYNFPMWIIMI